MEPMLAGAAACPFKRPSGQDFSNTYGTKIPPGLEFDIWVNHGKARARNLAKSIHGALALKISRTTEVPPILQSCSMKRQHVAVRIVAQTLNEVCSDCVAKHVW